MVGDEYSINKLCCILKVNVENVYVQKYMRNDKTSQSTSKHPQPLTWIFL